MGYHTYKAVRDRQPGYEQRYAAERAASARSRDAKVRQLERLQARFGLFWGAMAHFGLWLLTFAAFAAVVILLFGTLAHPR